MQKQAQGRVRKVLSCFGHWSVVTGFPEGEMSEGNAGDLEEKRGARQPGRSVAEVAGELWRGPATIHHWVSIHGCDRNRPHGTMLEKKPALQMNGILSTEEITKGKFQVVGWKLTKPGVCIGVETICTLTPLKEGNLCRYVMSRAASASPALSILRRLWAMSIQGSALGF